MKIRVDKHTILIILMDRSTSTDNNVRDRVNKQRPLNSTVFDSHQATFNQFKRYFDQKRRMKKLFSIIPFWRFRNLLFTSPLKHMKNANYANSCSFSVSRSFLLRTTRRTIQSHATARHSFSRVFILFSWISCVAR